MGDLETTLHSNFIHSLNSFPFTGSKRMERKNGRRSGEERKFERNKDRDPSKVAAICSLAIFSDLDSG